MMFEPDGCSQEELDSVHADREQKFERQAQAAREVGGSRYAAIARLRRQRAADWLQARRETL